MENMLIILGTAVVCLAGVGGLWFASKEIQEKISYKLLLGMEVSLCGLAWFLRWQYSADAFHILRYLTLCAVLWICAWTDFRKYMILNRVLLIALLLHVIWLAVGFPAYGSGEVKTMFLTGLIAAAMLAISAGLCRLFSSGAVGMGDIKLLIILGLYTDVSHMVEIMFCTFLVLFVVSVFLLITKRANRKSVLPFAPFLLVGGLTAAVLAGV